jgi:poly(3-hydroxybutyrate) depolymerase
MSAFTLHALRAGCLVSCLSEASGGWPTAVTKVEIPSSDSTRQPAMWFAPAGQNKKPLLVGLHTWSSSFDTAGGDAVYAEWCIARGWAFVHPHFRGPNRTPQAMGSDRAVEDIVEAVAWAKRQTAIDESRIYLVGVSGGGHMALLMAGRHPELWAGVSAWCGISDLAAWHAEHLVAGKPDEYARDIESALGRVPVAGDAGALRRSPLACLAAAAAVPLDINHGIRDGRSGSVPFTHSLRAWDSVVPDSVRLGPAFIQGYYDSLVLPSGVPDVALDPVYGKRRPLFRVSHANTRLTVFDGGHEIVHMAALNWLSLQRKGMPASWSVAKPVELESSEAGTGR